MWWSSLFTDMRPSDFFNFSFLPKYGVAFVRGIEYTLLLAVVTGPLGYFASFIMAISCSRISGRSSHAAGHDAFE